MDFYIIFKPSYNVRHIGGANRDNFKHFADTPSYKSISFDPDRSAHFPTGDAVSGRPIPDLGGATIDPTFVYIKQDEV